jgi:hypothetical protein
MAFITSGEIGTFLLIVGLQSFADSKKFDKILLSKGFWWTSGRKEWYHLRAECIKTKLEYDLDWLYTLDMQAAANATEKGAADGTLANLHQQINLPISLRYRWDIDYALDWNSWCGNVEVTGLILTGNSFHSVEFVNTYKRD